MTQSLTSILEQAEKAWLPELYQWSEKHFENFWIPSHDQFHHFRVWYYAKQLLQEASTDGFVPSEEFVLQLMLAVFFHDAGMTTTLAPEHGSISSALCLDFIQRKKIVTPGAMEETVQAVRNHEDKSYLALDNNPLSLLTFLNLADDLDALGCIGVYRYAEINFLRGIAIEVLPNHVLANLDRRYSHMLQRLPGQDLKWKNQISDRFSLIKNFFLAAGSGDKIDVNKQENTDAKTFQKVLQTIRQKVILEKIHPVDLVKIVQNTSIHQWWSAFNKEWYSFQYPHHE